MVNEKLKYITIKVSDVIASDYRLDARFYNIEGILAKEQLKKSKWEVINLWGDNGLIKNAFYPGRFKRLYVKKGKGIPMILPSQMMALIPKPTKFISEKTNFPLDVLKVNEKTLLLSRSGTIGNCTIVSKTLKGKTLSDDVIRISFRNDIDLGYVYCYIKSEIGNLVLSLNNYGSVIRHIEPEHLYKVSIPNPPDHIKKPIHDLIMQSYDLRDQSNVLIQEAEKLLIEELQLPPIEQLEKEADYYDKKIDFVNMSVPVSELNMRFDASYHLPIVKKIIAHLEKYAENVKLVGNRDISKNIIMAGRFKRRYVKEGKGIIFLGGKQLYELNPTNKKYLSRSYHGKRIAKQLFLTENMIAVTCSGTIGKVKLIPKHWENWTLNQHVLRIVPKDNTIAGYIYVWLNTSYGSELIKRHTYGSVVDEIHDFHLANVEIPILKNQETQKRINNLALQANKLRSEAYYKEQEALDLMNETVIYAED